MPFQKMENCLDQNDFVTDKDMNGKERDDWIDSKRNERIRCSLLRFAYLFSPMSRQSGMFSEKVSLCISKYKKASIAVETALVLPLFFLGMVTLISFMDIYRIQTEHLQALCQRVKEAGMYACVLEKEGPEEITLPDFYSYTPVGGLIPLPKLHMSNIVTVHAWTGKSVSESPEIGEAGEEMVYVTEEGSVYHRNQGCRYLSVALDYIPGTRVASARNSRGEKYGPCEVCSRNQKPAGAVYITKSGNRYHNRKDCSSLKRKVRLVKISQIHGMSACSLCG